VRLGWQVLRARFRQDVSVPLLRRALRIGAVVAVAVGLLLGVTEATSGWMDVGPWLSVLAVVLGALGAGLVTVSAFPVRLGAEPPATINGYQVRPDTMRIARQSVQRYLGRRMPAVEPVDREAVLNDTALIRRTVVVDVVRIAPGVLGLAFLGVTVGMLSDWRFVAFIVTLGYLGLVPDRLRSLGRAERAHRAAVALPPVAAPVGSKVERPGA
jgi:hypothetical protein